MNIRSLLSLAALGILLMACQPTDEQRAQPLMTRIEQLYAAGRYQAVLDSITQLRLRHPRAVKARLRALALWQEASLRLAQQDIARTDSALQAAIAAYNQAGTIRARNEIRLRRDSLQVRYDVLVGTVRVIHRRQQEK